MVLAFDRYFYPPPPCFSLPPPQPPYSSSLQPGQVKYVLERFWRSLGGP